MADWPKRQLGLTPFVSGARWCNGMASFTMADTSDVDDQFSDIFYRPIYR